MTPLLLCLLGAALLPGAAQAALVERLPYGATTATLLLCDNQVPCAEDATWVQGLGVVGEEPFLALDTLLELDAGGWVDGVDQKTRLERSLAEALEAARKGRWKEAETQADAALDATRRWAGTVPAETLFTAWFIQGAARLHRGTDRGHEYSFRQAAGVLDQPPKVLPLDDPKAVRAWTDEQRKLLIAGRGTLVLQGVPREARVFIDGNPLPFGVAEVALYPGNHRITATREGLHRTFVAEVPILADRSSALQVEFPASSSVAWVTHQLSEMFDTLRAPDEVRDLLGDWCRRNGVVEVRIVWVQGSATTAPAPEVDLGWKSPLRPKAAEGEAVDMGDGVPATFEDHVLIQHEAAGERRPAPERRLRVAWFDPAGEQFFADGGTLSLLGDQDEERFTLGLTTGYQRVLENHHATLDVGALGRTGPVWTEARLGLVRSGEPYNLYQDWVDRQLYHIYLGARYTVDRWRVRPWVGAGPEVYIPMAWGGRLMVGAETRLGRGVKVSVEGVGTFLDQGLGAGAGVTVGWGG